MIWERFPVFWNDKLMLTRALVFRGEIFLCTECLFSLVIDIMTKFTEFFEVSKSLRKTKGPLLSKA